MSDNIFVKIGLTLLGLASLVAIPCWVAWLSIAGPYGALQKQPECPAGRMCVLVAGLDGDVLYNPFGGGSVAFDVSDDSRQELVLAMRDIASDVVVRTMPHEITPPVIGANDEERQVTAAVTEARAIGQRKHATLVVVGSVVGPETLRLAFVDPQRERPWVIRDYSFHEGRGTAAFRLDYFAALRGAQLPPSAPLVVVADASSAPNAAARAPVQPVPEVETPPDTTTATTQPISTSAPVRTPVVVDPSVRTRPSEATLSRYYPRAGHNQTGVVFLHCKVAVDQRLHECRATSEFPANSGFGDAAVSLAERTYRYNPMTVDGQPVDGGETDIRIVFQPS